MILLSVYCTKTAIDIFTLSFYRLIFLHCLSCVCQLFIKDHHDDDDDALDSGEAGIQTSDLLIASPAS